MATEQKLLNKLLGSFEYLTGYTAVIQSDHAYIHQGLGFSGLVDAGSISSTYYIGFTTPSVASGKYIHWRPIGIQSSADYVSVKIYEGDTFSGGDAVTPINRNRAMATTTSNMQAFSSDVTSSPSGTIIYLTGIGVSGNPASQSGGGGSANEEILLKANTNYVIEIDPDGATNVTMELFWYEEEAPSNS